jgi:hypothetical protein
MMKRYILGILSVGILLFLNGCSDVEEEIRKYAAEYYGKLADQGNQRTHEDHNDTSDDTSDDGDENNDTGDSDDEPEVEEVQRIVSIAEEASVRENWYVRLTVTDLSNGLVFKGAKLGELEEEDAEEKYSLKAINPFGGAFIDIVFEDPKAVVSGNYAVFFLHTDLSSEQRWRFKVRATDTDAEILLQWRGVFVLDPYTDAEERYRYREHLALHHTLWKQMKLIDMETMEEIPTEGKGVLQSYRFLMNGKEERSFEWVVSTEPLTDKMETKAYGDDRRPAASKLRIEHAPVKFDLDHPPSFKENE